MKRFLLSTILTLTMAGAAFAKTPPEVLKPFKEYAAAMKAGDAKLADQKAYEAWQKAEEVLGDNKTTGDLANNYAMVLAEQPVDGKMDKKLYKRKAKAFERAMELTAGHGADANLMHMERGINLVNFMMANREKFDAYNIAKDISEFGEANNLANNTFYAEALTIQAGYHVSTGNHKKVEKLSNKALDAFTNGDHYYDSAMHTVANLYRGYGLEAQNKTKEAALSYQKVMEALDGVQANEHPLAAKALGRWSHMRYALRNDGLLEEAEAEGLCKCWPYNVPRNENVKPIKRVQPKMPKEAWVSGFSIVEFDLDDAGKTINPKILVSWPEGVFEESSLKSLSGWEYKPRIESETDADRENIITTIRYSLSDKHGNLLF